METDWKSPQTVEAVGTGGSAWTGTSNLASANNQYATSSVSGGFAADNLRLTNFGFNVPANAVITGIASKLEASATGGTGIARAGGRLVKGGVAQGNSVSNGPIPSSDYIYVNGGDGELWGTSLSPADVNASTFGFLLGGSVDFLTGSADINVDHFQLKAFYTMPDPIPVRGQWLLSRAIAKHWLDSPLESQFRQAWGSTDAARNRTDCTPFNDTSAKPVAQHPRPYVVYQEQEPIRIGNSSGRTADTKIAYIDVPVDFRVYGSSKREAAKWAAYVMGLFSEKARLPILQDRHLQTLHGDDFAVQEDAKSWFWFFPLRFRIEGDYQA